MASSPVRLSVVIASYNRAPLLHDCVASLRNAQVPGLHLIVVDDGSTDDTRQVVASLGSDIEYIYQENKGLSAARNTGIEAATSTYIAYLDSDDFWLPGVATGVMDMLDRHPTVGAIFTETRVGNLKDGYHSWKEAAGTRAFDELPSTELEPGLRLLESQPLYRLMIRRNVIFTGAVIQRRELVVRAGLFDPAIKAIGDWELWMRMIPLARFAFWPQPLAIYTRHADNMTNDEDLMGRAFCDTLVRHAAKNGEWYRRNHELFRSVLADHLFYFGYQAFQRGALATARERFASGLRLVPFDHRMMAYWALACLPAPFVASIRRWRGGRH